MPTGILGPGWVQWMTAGRGVVHSEMPTEELMKSGGKVEGFQLWVNLPSKEKMIPPKYQDTPPEKLPVVKTDDGKTTIKVIAGTALGKHLASISKNDHTRMIHTSTCTFSKFRVCAIILAQSITCMIMSVQH